MGNSRVVLFTGKGGVGKTTAAAMTAGLVAESGRRTLVVSTDPAHSLADVCGVALRDEPTAISSCLDGVHVDARARFVDSWETVRSYLVSVLAVGGLDAVSSHEVLAPPGVDEVCGLLAVSQYASTGEYDAILVDCAPTADTLRLLTIPAALGWLLERFTGVPSALRSGLWKAFLPEQIPMPDAGVLSAARRLQDQLAHAAALLQGPHASLRLVLTPERIVTAEAMRLYTTATILGFTVDSIIVNRVMSRNEADEWRVGWASAHEQRLVEIERDFGELPIVRLPYLPAEPVGMSALAALGESAYGVSDPLGSPRERVAVRVEKTSDGYSLVIPAPGADPADLDVVMIEDELQVSTRGYRRRLAVPAALRGRCVAGAQVHSGALWIEFDDVVPEGSAL